MAEELGKRAFMAKYIIYFNQQWVGDHSEEWFESRGPLANQVVKQMEDAGVVVFAGGLEEEIDQAKGFDETGNLTAPITTKGEFLGGMTIIDVPSEDEANFWGAEIARACGWPQEVRRFKD